MNTFNTREEWLNAAMILLHDLFGKANLDLPAKIKVSCGWPYNKAGAKGRIIGQCFKDICSAGGFNEIFISPVLQDPIKVLEVLVHEMCHAAENCKSKHGAGFKKIALAVGLTGKMTATEAGPELLKTLEDMVETLGVYPHSTLNVSKQQKKQTTRLLKVYCPDCGYTVRITRAWINQAVPDCPLCGKEMTVDKPEEEG